jgi:hypothetical protein
LAIGGGMFLQKKCSELLAQKTGHVLAFRERYQLALIHLSEHPLKGLSSA